MDTKQDLKDAENISDYTKCFVCECIYNQKMECTNTGDLCDSSKGLECVGLEYDCILCQETGFQHFECSDCCLDEDDYYGDDYF